MIGRIIASTLAYALILFLVIEFLPELGFAISPASATTPLNLIILWAIFGFTISIVGGLIELILFPVKVLSLWLLSLPLNIIVTILLFYLFQRLVSEANLGVEIILWNIIQILILSVVISILHFIFKKIL